MKCRNIWEKIGGRKFIVWCTNEAAIIGIGLFVGAKYGGEWGLAVIVGGLLINGLIYSAANVWVKGSFGGASIAMGDGHGMDKKEPEGDRDSHPGARSGGAVGHVPDREP